MDSTTIKLPHNFTLRDYQKPAWDYLIKGGDRACLIWHRRAGKDIFCHNFAIASAVQTVGNYWHIMPYYAQIRKALWEARTATGQSYIDFIPKEIIKSIKNQEMAIHLKNGSIIRFLGGDRPNTLVGAAPKGLIISEWALQRPSLWYYLEPILLENKGWAIFNTTPRGNNHAKETYNNFSNSNKFASLLTITDTKAITVKQIEEIRISGTPEEIIQQEYYCSFAGTIQGAYYGDIINQLEKKEYEQICSVPYDEQSLVHTYWDLGIDDMTSIWFIQFIGKEIRVIDYYENHNQRLSYYTDVLSNSKQYKYGSHNLPHDGNTRELGSGKTRAEMLMETGLVNVKNQKRNPEPYNGIIKVRALLSRCFFDRKKTKDGLDALKNYHREYDENRKTFKTRPEHDWSSHGADAFRLMAETHSETINRPIRTEPVIVRVRNII